MPSPPPPARPRNAKVNPKTVVKMREWYASGKWNLNQLAKHFELAWPTTRAIINGTSWADVGGPVDPKAGQRK